jgi:hypothetical protein
MTDDNYNIVKPVESHQNITGLTPAEPRDEKKKRQNLNKQENRQHELAKDELNESGKEDIGNEIDENDQDKHSIDYCV